MNLSCGHNAYPLPQREQQLPKRSPEELSEKQEPAGGALHLLLGLGSDPAEGLDELEVLVCRQLQGKLRGSCLRPSFANTQGGAQPPTLPSPPPRSPHLAGAHFGQLLQEDLNEVTLHPVGGLAIGDQDLGRQQLQQLLNLSEERKERIQQQPWQAPGMVSPTSVTQTQPSSTPTCNRLM